MRRSTKVFLGIVTICPAIYVALFVVFIFLFFSSFVFGTPAGSELSDVLRLIPLLHLSVFIVIVGLAVFYIFHLIKNEFVMSETKALWVALLILGNTFSMPVYWYLYIWSRKEKGDSG